METPLPQTSRELAGRHCHSMGGGAYYCVDPCVCGDMACHRWIGASGNRLHRGRSHRPGAELRRADGRAGRSRVLKPAERTHSRNLNSGNACGWKTWKPWSGGGGRGSGFPCGADRSAAGRWTGPGPGRFSWTGSARWTRVSFARLPRNGGATGPRLCQPATA